MDHGMLTSPWWNSPSTSNSCRCVSSIFVPRTRRWPVTPSFGTVWNCANLLEKLRTLQQIILHLARALPWTLQPRCVKKLIFFLDKEIQSEPISNKNDGGWTSKINWLKHQSIYLSMFRSVLIQNDAKPHTVDGKNPKQPPGMVLKPL